MEEEWQELKKQIDDIFFNSLVINSIDALALCIISVMSFWTDKFLIDNIKQLIESIKEIIDSIPVNDLPEDVQKHL